MAWQRTERANLLAAVTQAATPPGRRIDLTAAIASLLLVDSPGAEAEALHTAAARDARALGDIEGAADALRNRGQVRMSGRHGFDEAKEDFEQALADYRTVGNRSGQADVLFRIGMALSRLDDAAGALHPERESVRIFQEIGDRHGEAYAWQTLASTERQLGRNRDALRSSQAAVAIFRESDNRPAEATALQHLGYAECDLGEFQSATETLGRALAINREYGLRQAEGAVLNVLGRIHLARGEHERADAALRDSLAAFAELQYAFGEAIVETHLGQLRAAEGNHAAGIEHLEHARTLFAPLANLYCEAEVDRELGWVLYSVGDPRGEKLLERATESYRTTVDDVPGETEALIYLGRIAEDRGDPRAGIERHGRALELARDTHRQHPEALALDGLARCHVQLGEPAAALEPLREAVELYRRMGLAELAGAEQRLAALSA